MPYPGSILALSWYSNAAKTAGTVYFSPYVNGVIKTGAIGSWVTGTSYGTQTWPASTYVFAAGDRLDIRVSTNSAFLPTTADVEVLAYVTFDPANQ